MIDHNNTGDLLQDDLRKVNSKRANKASNNSTDYNQDFTNEINSRQANQDQG